MDSQESPSVHHHQQEQPQPPRGHGSMALSPNPPLRQPYQQQQQKPPPHGHGAMEETPTLPPPPSPPQPKNHQQEQTNSYMLPAKIFHQPKQQKRRGRPKKSFDDGLRFSPTLTSKSPRASPSENPYEKSHGSLLRSRKKQHPQTLDSNVGGDDVASSENPSKKPLEKLSFGNKHMQEDLGVLGSGWTPHLIPINIGEDIVRKVVTFTEQGPRPRIVRIISASGVVSDVTLHKFSIGGGTVTYEVVLFTAQSLDKENPESKAPSSSLTPNVLNSAALITKVTSPSCGASSNLVGENGDSPLNRE